MATETRQKAVTDILRQMVLEGEFAAGEHLMEVPLGKRLGVSRTPVRAALMTLAQEGMLSYMPQRGYLIREVNLPRIIDAYRVRAHLEGLACRILAEAGLDPEAEKTLQGCLRAGDAILAKGTLRDEDNEAWSLMNDLLHRTILGATRNETLIDVTERTLALPMLSSRVVHWHDYEALKTSHYLHHVIVRAIQRREGERAEAAMREHVWAGLEVIEQRYQDRLTDTHVLDSVSDVVHGRRRLKGAT